MMVYFQIHILLMLSIYLAVGDPSCGTVKLNQQIESDTWSALSRRIVGGNQSEEGAWPWQVALLLHGTQWCGGSLVSPHWVVSATHCFHGTKHVIEPTFRGFYRFISGYQGRNMLIKLATKYAICRCAYCDRISTNPADWRAVLGEHHLHDREVFEQNRGVEAIYLHPKYKSMYLEGIYDTPPENDIALVRLLEPAVYDDYVSPICLLDPGMKFPLRKECYVSGWGDTMGWEASSPDILREAKVRLVPREICNSALSYNGTIHNSALCAGFEEGGVDSCQGDSGGPLSCEYRGRFYLTGVTSWGHGCAQPHKYGVYANMFELTSWVKKVMIENSNVEM